MTADPSLVGIGLIALALLLGGALYLALGRAADVDDDESRGL